MLTLTEIAHQLTVATAPPAWVHGHRCVPPLGYDPPPLGYPTRLGYDPSPLGYEPPVVCSHPEGPGPSLMVALAELVEPGSSPSSDSSPTGRRPEGSPAPWDPRAGELLDEICRGALRLEASARTWLRLSAARHGSADLVVRGQSAVVALPQLVEWVEARHPEHPLVRGASLSARHPERGHRPGEIEAWLRSVHRRSVELVTGSSPPPRLLSQMPNPIPVEWRLRWAGSPICHDRLPTQQLVCDHLSCLRAAYARMGSVVPLWCPFCWHRGLTEDQLSGLVWCASCVDSDGDRHEWQSAAWAVDVVSSMIQTELGVPR